VRTPEVTTPLLEGIVVPGNNLAAKLDWLPRNAESHNIYIIEVNANENVAPRALEFKGAINITVALRGDSINRILRLASNGTMFTVTPNVTFVLENNITLQGHPQNTGPMIEVAGGTLKMNDGATITGNSNLKDVSRWVGADCKNAGGICVSFGNFEMNGGTISNNMTKGFGGGVYFSGSENTFKMNKGTISGNTASNGGGVYLRSGHFTMNGGTISGNTNSGVHLDWQAHNVGTFTMVGGTISDNTAVRGGGVNVLSGAFIMQGGTIIGNVAEEYGGGVFVDGAFRSGVFTKTGSSTIIGYNSDQINGNVVRDKEGVLARRGHAVYKLAGSKRKETTSGARENLSSERSENWDE
jgi:hypothetical protein